MSYKNSKHITLNYLKEQGFTITEHSITNTKDEIVFAGNTTNSAYFNFKCATCLKGVKVNGTLHCMETKEKVNDSGLCNKFFYQNKE